MDTANLIGICGLTAPVIILAWNIGVACARRGKKPTRESFVTGKGRHNNVYSLEQPEVIVIGSGVVGSAVATALARDGRFVTVIERDLNEPDRIVGELLQPGGVRALHQLGLSNCVENIDAQIVNGYVVHDLETGAHVEIPYPTFGSQKQQGRSFHHGRFVQNLRGLAQDEPRIRMIEANVVNLLESEDSDRITGVEYKLRDSEQTSRLTAPLTIVCDGHFSRFRQKLVRENVQVSSHFVGLLMEKCPQYLPLHAELVLGNPSPVLIYCISEQHTRVLVDVQGKLPKNMPDFMVSEIAPQLPDHIRQPFLDAVSSGDAYNMRHPLTGGGMSVGLHDVILWRNALRNVADCADVYAVRKAQTLFHRQRKNNHAFVVNVLAQALYALFSASDRYLHSLRKACFEYFKLGGECVAGPVGLLSVLNPSPWKLLGHFFAVAFYAVYCNYRDIRSFRSLRRFMLYPLGIVSKACSVIFPLIWSEIKTIVVY
ncbi:squalene monooxygenase-like isoform X2 [Paramacrobiotus metropolitanus]|uniref:squalene monooxygenase-like isoform X2 n=1 Tax=Paramacrobiotus metropolitanus TaxID=2943436 RepID=UPI002445BFF6|nr:squalene monooxygenase-like isoform X2 [Paramacrobiotus metropolitanus]